MLDPKIIVTTSRDPSSKLLQFAKEMRLVFPGSHRINRGNYVVKELAEACRANDVSDLIIFHEHRGVPGQYQNVIATLTCCTELLLQTHVDAMIVSHFPHGPTLYFTLHNVNLRHDIDSYKKSTVSEQYPHLIFENFNSQLGERVRDALKYLFPVPKEDSKRVMTFSNENDFISFRRVQLILWYPSNLTSDPFFRHHVFMKIPPNQVQLAEVGPRFEMKREFQSLHLRLSTDCKSTLIHFSLRDSTRDHRADRSGKGMGSITLFQDSQKAQPFDGPQSAQRKRTQLRRACKKAIKTMTLRRVFVAYPVCFSLCYIFTS